MSEEKSKTVKEEIDELVANLRSKVSSYKDRPSQKVMIAQIAQTFWFARNQPEGEVAKPHIAVLEAPTGTGKSHGYLIPSIVLGRRLKKKVVVSSSTVKLQEQLYNYDLPLLSSCVDGGVKFALVKGRSRYVCPKLLENEASEAGQMQLSQDSASEAVQKRDEKVIHLHRIFTEGDWNGERDAVPVDEKLWSDITTDRHGCTGHRCSHLKVCPFFKAREDIKQADILVVNHDLLLADLALGGGKLLTEPEETLYCLDECHNLPDKTLQAFASQHQVASAARLAERLTTTFDRAIPDSIAVDEMSRHAESLAESLNDLDQMLQQIESLKKKDASLRFPFGVINEDMATIAMNILTSSEGALSALDDFRKEVETLVNEGIFTPESSEKVMTDSGFYVGKLEAVRDTWKLMLTVTDEKAPPIAKWISTLGEGRDRDFLVCASPVSAAAKLRFELWDRAHAAVLTSATISSLGNFNLFKLRSGLSIGEEDSFCRALASPFDYAKQGKIVVPKMQSNPKNAEEHTKEICQIIPKLFIQEPAGMLVLFSSRRQMEDVAASLSKSQRDMVLVQGEVPMSELIERHRANVDAGRTSVLFGLAGLAEGLDLPGAYNVRVIIAKLPFSVPTNPIDAATAEWLESIGRNPFVEISVPEAAMRLSQGVGRLLRTETDYGDIYILDSRLTATTYGKNMLKGLPPFPLVTDQVF